MKNETNNKKIKEQENKTSEEEKGYKVITREKLIKKVKHNKSNVKCYFNTDYFIPDNTDEVIGYLISVLKLIPRIQIYFASEDLGREQVLEQMLVEIKENDSIMVKSLNEIRAILDTELFLEFLMKLLINNVDLYLIDYVNDKFIEIDVHLLIMRILTEKIYCFFGLDFSNAFDELLYKYYDMNIIY